MIRHPLFAPYAMVTVLLIVFGVLLRWVVLQPSDVVASADLSRTILPPILWLLALTAVIWVLMATFRNFAVIMGGVNMHYFRIYRGDAPPEWIERPSRAFSNLLEVPLLFYLLCVLSLQTGVWDSVQTSLAWVFVAVRYLHAAIHIGINYVPIRFGAYVMGCATVAVMWWRFAGLFFAA